MSVLSGEASMPSGPESSPRASFEDSMLVEGVRKGDERAFLLLLERHQGAMLRLARFYVANEATAEDVVQETWIAILRGIHGFDGRSSLKTWMYRILTNRAKTIGVREHKSVPDGALVAHEVDRSEPAVPADRFLDLLDNSWPGHWRQPPLAWERTSGRRNGASVAQVVLEAIDALSSVQKVVITLRDIECWSAAEVCNALELSETNQRVLLHRARSKVRQHLETHFRDTREE